MTKSRKMTSDIAQNFADHKASFMDKCVLGLELELLGFCFLSMLHYALSVWVPGTGSSTLLHYFDVF